MARLLFTTYAESTRHDIGETRGLVIGNNTRAYRDPRTGRVIITLHHHHIVTLYPDGSVYASDAGYWTVTTKERINQFLQPVGARVFSKRGTPTLVDGGVEYPWYGDALVDPAIPSDYEVQPVDPSEAVDPVTCGTCHRTWDDSIVTGITPAPSARCPFEPFHTEEVGA